MTEQAPEPFGVRVESMKPSPMGGKGAKAETYYQKYKKERIRLELWPKALHVEIFLIKPSGFTTGTGTRTKTYFRLRSRGQRRRRQRRGEPIGPMQSATRAVFCKGRHMHLPPPRLPSSVCEHHPELRPRSRLTAREAHYNDLPISPFPLLSQPAPNKWSGRYETNQTSAMACPDVSLSLALSLSLSLSLPVRFSTTSSLERCRREFWPSWRRCRRTPPRSSSSGGASWRQVARRSAGFEELFSDRGWVVVVVVVVVYR